MNFSEVPPSKQWAVLKYRGEKLAEVWFKPAGEPLSLMFRIPRESFQIPVLAKRLTTEALLKAVSIAPEQVESWSCIGVSHAGGDGSNPELGQPLPPPQNASYLAIDVSLKPPAPVDAGEDDRETEESAAAAESAAEEPAPEETAAPEALAQAATAPAAAGSGETDTPKTKWQELEARWNAILGVEATIDTLRQTLEGIQAQMETAAKKTLMTEEKVNALNADVMAWTKAKARVHYAVPKIKEFTHRATWVMGTPERKRLDELAECFKNHTQPDMTLAEMTKVGDQLENLLKDRQVLLSHGGTIHQECKNVASDIQGSLQQLLNNARARADKKRRSGRPKGKFFKTVRKWSGAD